MTNEEFKQALTEYKYYLKPALFTVLSGNADVFSEETKKEIVGKLREADQHTRELYDYQEKRNNIFIKGLERIEEIYANIKTRFKKAGESERASETAQADRLISNL